MNWGERYAESSKLPRRFVGTCNDSTGLSEGLETLEDRFDEKGVPGKGREKITP